MTMRFILGVAIAIGIAASPAAAADDAGLTRMATCQDSWLAWQKSDPAQLKSFGERFRAAFTRKGNDPFFFPKSATSIMGLRVVQAFPESVGMGVGFSVTVDATFDATRKVFEKAFGKKLGKCETGDGMHTCELDIAELKTFAVMTGDNDPGKTLVGCYYYYEK